MAFSLEFIEWYEIKREKEEGGGKKSTIIIK